QRLAAAKIGETRRLRQRVEEASGQLAAAETELVSLRRKANDAQSALGNLQGQLNVAEDALAERKQAKTEGTCSHCGQKITPEHMQAELARCRRMVEDLVGKVRDANEASKNVAASVQAGEKLVSDNRINVEKARNRLDQLDAIETALAELEEQEVMHE